MPYPIAPHAPANPDPLWWRYDGARAERAIAFVEKLLVHTKGRTAGHPFYLSEWQKEGIFRPLFGTLRYDDQFNEWTRQYRMGWIELGRKNGKSEIASAIALLGLVGDDEESAEVYSVAADKDQAALVFNTAKRMVELSPVLSKRLEIIDSRKRIVDRKSNSVYAVLPGDAAGALGVNASMVLMDEVLTQKDRHLFDAMRQSFGTRTQPLMLCITTAAYTSARFALEEHDFSERVERDQNLDPSRFVYLRNLPKEADWTDEGSPGDPANGIKPTGWYWANPALGDFLNINTLRDEFRDAKEKPSAENAFRVFRLNQWVAQATRWISMDSWAANADKPVSRSALTGRACFAGLDLASTSDFTAWVLLFPGTADDPTAPGFTVLPRFWVPRAAIERRQEQREEFLSWEKLGYLTITDGETVDYERVYADITADAETFNIQHLGYDPWNALQIVQRLEDGGLSVVKVPQSATRLNEPCKMLEGLISERTFRHGANPVLAWMANNVEIEYKADGLMKPKRTREADKIDGIAASLNALAVSLVPAEDPPEVEFISFT
ncbi:terminase large subunit [Kitasatospora sp. NPDC001309]|uniref:terminase large subunit n=1 Tax=Kitasatospora sp. NPDC001309 TaxID=3364013 RepID=UPI00368511E7